MFVFKHNTVYEMRIIDWSSDVCSSDLVVGLSVPVGASDDYAGGSIQRLDIGSGRFETLLAAVDGRPLSAPNDIVFDAQGGFYFTDTGKHHRHHSDHGRLCHGNGDGARTVAQPLDRSEEHTSELQSLMRTSYAVFCLTKKTTTH